MTGRRDRCERARRRAAGACRRPLGAARRIAWTAGLTLALALAVAGCSLADARPPAGQSDPPLTPAATSTPTVAPSPSATRPAPTRLATLPGGGRRLFPGHRIVAYYGAAGIPAMGVLGSGPPEQVWARLATMARRYQTPKVAALPTFELIAVIANGYPGPDGMYRTRVDHATIGRYLAVARRHHGLLLLDVQPGRADFPTEVRQLERWLREPDVALAIDPEWRMSQGGVPGQLIGSVQASEVNAVSAWLDDLTVRYRLPEKLLLVHQFTTGMVLHKAAVLPRRHLAMVFNMDGFGGREAKLYKYRLLAADRRFGLGLKLFYRQDIAMFGAPEVLRLRPAPDVVEYQ